MGLLVMTVMCQNGQAFAMFDVAEGEEEQKGLNIPGIGYMMRQEVQSNLANVESVAVNVTSLSSGHDRMRRSRG